jgi:DNA-directed RNA polymerase subunit RPC12/RpoP
MTRRYRCESCGATWVSYPKGEDAEKTGRCLRCDGHLVPAPGSEEPVDSVEDDAEA